MTSDSVFVPSAPVWALVRRKQAAWGYSNQEMAAFLDLGRCVDARALMLRTTAERILRRLDRPAPATVGTHAAWRRLRTAEASLPKAPDSPEERRRIAAELAGESGEQLAGEELEEAAPARAAS